MEASKKSETERKDLKANGQMEGEKKTEIEEEERE